MVVRASVAAMVIAMLLVILCVSCVFLCGVQLLHLGDSPFQWPMPTDTLYRYRRIFTT